MPSANITLVTSSNEHGKLTSLRQANEKQILVVFLSLIINHTLKMNPVPSQLVIR
jgi:hypothetical protein